MSTHATAEEFLDLYQKSDLYDAARFSRTFPNASELPNDPRDCAAALVQAGLLTAYQARQLLLGKHKGFLLGSYKILQPVGKGGMGTVFLAEHTAMKRRVALKVIQLDPSQGRLSLERIHREARSAAALEHPNIVRLFDVGQQGKIHFLAMEYVDGETLDTLLDKGNPPPFAQAVAYVVQAAAGLQHAHEKGLVHRDIKPGNLMLSKDGTIKLLDMGLARSFVNESDNLTGSLGNDAETFGTADYVSPEQALNLEVDARGDVYSLGATLYALIAGFPPFRGTTLQKLAQLQTVEPTPLSTLRQEVPEGLSDVVSRMMAKCPSDRYEGAAEVIEALSPWLPGAKRKPTVVAVAAPPVAPSVRLREVRPERKVRALAFDEPKGGLGWGAWSLIGGSAAFTLVCVVGVTWLFLRPAAPVEVKPEAPPVVKFAPAPAAIAAPAVKPEPERPVDSRFDLFPIEKYATSTTRRPLFFADNSEILSLPTSPLVWASDVPFRLGRANDDKAKNVIQLHSILGEQSNEAPESVTLPINAPVAALHFLGGIGGWAWPWKRPNDSEELRGKVAMRLRLVYEDKTVEVHEWRNGEEVADWVRQVDVPNSAIAFHCYGGRQVRYLALRPRRNGEVVRELVLEKGEVPELSNIVVGLTIEKKR